jgi:hypothetical protein
MTQAPGIDPKLKQKKSPEEALLAMSGLPVTATA